MNNRSNYLFIIQKYYSSCISDEFYNHTEHNMPVAMFFMRRSVMTNCHPKGRTVANTQGAGSWLPV